MVSGHLFHFRKNSWPPEEYVGRSSLQLLDFDGGAPPKQAWRRRLNSHANKLKEFSVTFMEAMRMMSLGLRLWSYVREEASHGRFSGLYAAGESAVGAPGLLFGERLERNVERLSKVLATNVPALPEEEILRRKQEAVNLAKIVETLCGEMYKCIQDELLPLLVEPMKMPPWR